MPGIFGVVDERAPAATNVALARAIAERLVVHDALRIDLDATPTGPAVLGRVDLGIFDARPAPARSPDGACRLVLHGEVRGVAGGAAGVLAAYLADGDAALRGLSGSFALALWDGRRRRLVLVNDRFALRNVYWAADENRLVFAPQVTALLADPRLARALDAQAAVEFLTFQCVLRDRTLIDGIRILPPASCLVFEPGRGARLESTWSLRYRARPADDHPRALAAALVDATSRLAGDDRVGLPLSGGLDSRTLLAALPRRPLATITYGRRGSDDLRLGAELAARAGTVHQAIELAPGYIAREAATMVERTDGMHSCLNAHAALLRDARRICDVVLLGNGGDCLLDGLWTGPADASADAIATRLFGKLAIGLAPSLARDVVHPGGPLADAFNVVHRHRRWVLQGVPAQATHVEFRHPYYDAAVVDVALAVPAALRADRRAHVDALKILSPELARVRRQGKPFGFAVPPWRWQLHVTSARVRDAVRWRANRAGLNPFVARPNRRSFADYDDELRHGSRALLTDVLLAGPTLERGWWRADGVRRLVAEHLAGRANHSTGLGVVLTLELFARAVFTEERADAEPIKSTA